MGWAEARRDILALKDGLPSTDTHGSQTIAAAAVHTNCTLDLAARLYSDDLTPDVHFTHTIDSRKKTVIDAAGWLEFDYNSSMKEVRETIHHTNAPTNLAISVFERAHDAQGRPAGISLRSNAYHITYTYDGDGRFKSVDYQIGTNTGSAIYTWHPDAQSSEVRFNWEETPLEVGTEVPGWVTGPLQKGKNVPAPIPGGGEILGWTLRPILFWDPTIFTMEIKSWYMRKDAAACMAEKSHSDVYEKVLR